MKCPNCGYGADRPARWKYDLVFMSGYNEPIWGGPKSRGIDLKESDADLRYLVENGYAVEVRTGFQITQKGMRCAQQLKRELGFSPTGRRGLR